MELKREVGDNGDIVTVNVDVDNSKNKLIVLFKVSKYSDNNKWNESQVLTDVEVSRCQISDIYKNADPTGIKLLDYITSNKKNIESIIKNVEQISSKADHIYIGLPTSVTLFDSPRRIRNSFRPLIVEINDEDGSRCFQDFDVFNSRAVNVAYDALINGKNPSSENNIVSFYEVGYLHNRIFSQSFSEEQESEK